MTRIIIFSDLHANWEALLALQQAEPQPDAIICLGDIVGYGPDPKRCLDSVRANAAHIIGGQHDFAVGSGAINVQDELLESSWRHTRWVLPANDWKFLATLPAELTVTLAGVRFHLVRLGPDNLDTETDMLITMSQAQLRERFGHIEADFILLGGPHIPAMRQLDGRLFVCPGSLGLPRYGVPDPTFAAWHNGHMQIHHLHYHPETTLRKLSLLPLDPDFVGQLQMVLQSGGVEKQRV